MKKYWLILVFINFCSTAFSNDVGPENKFNLVHDYQDEWLIFNSSEKEFYPTSKNDLSQKAHYLLIDPNEFPGTTLLIKASSKDNYLFFNGHLATPLPLNKWLEFPFDDLRKKYGNELLNISVFGTEDLNNLEVVAAFPKTQVLDSLQREIKQKQTGYLLNIKAREANPFRNIISLSIVFLMGFFGFLKVSLPKEFRIYYTPKNIFDFQLKQNLNLLKSGLGSPNIYFIFTLCLIQIIITFILIEEVPKIGQIKFFTFINENPYGNWTSFLMLFGFFFALYLIKYGIIYFGGKLFNSDKLIEVHFFKILNIDTQFSLLILILFLIALNLGWFGSLFTSNNLIILLLLYFLARSIILFFTIKRQLGFKNLYLISYLCIVEFLPLMIGFRILY